MFPAGDECQSQMALIRALLNKYAVAVSHQTILQSGRLFDENMVLRANGCKRVRKIDRAQGTCDNNY